MDDPVTEDLVAEEAEDTIKEWLHKHYTLPLADGRQRRFALQDDDEHIVFGVSDKYGHHPDRFFRVSVIVEEVK